MESTDNTLDVYELGNNLGYLNYMIERFVEMIGEEETVDLLKYNEKKLSKTIRLNSLRSPFERTKALLKKKGVVLRNIEYLPEGIEIIESDIPIGATPEYLNGYYILQGKNSMYPSKILDPKEGEVIGDLTAAPGGKTTHLAQLMNNKGNIIALEISANRCRSLKSNLARMGVINTIVVQIDLRDVCNLELEFDKILLDAPCSGSGIIASDPTRKNSKNLSDINNHHNYQVELLKKSVKALKEKGEIVYCTCSLEPEENEQVISEVIKESNLKLVEIGKLGEPALEQFLDQKFHPDLIKARRLYPHKTSGEGFFIAKMVKK